jgi:hypothetical protein
MASTKHNPKHRKPELSPTAQELKEALSADPGEQSSTELHLTSRASLTDMMPGDMIFLDEISYLRESFAPNFVAVLACPRCGSPGLITSSQFAGAGPIVCVSRLCPGQFRIINEAQIVSLPVS